VDAKTSLTTTDTLNLLAAIIIYWNTKHLGFGVNARTRVRTH